MVGAVILAAGAGRRMGGEGKALLDVGGVSFLERVIRTCREGGCDPIWITVRSGDDAVEEMAHSLGCRLVINPDPDLGMFSSVHLGLVQAIQTEPPPGGILIFPVDHPRVREETVKDLIAALPGKPERTCVHPVFKGRGGHPVLLDLSAAKALIECEHSAVFREVLGQAGITPHGLVVSDPHIRENLNTPDDLPTV